MKFQGWPDKGELVVGNVDEIANFGVFVDLEEYDEKRGLIHISEVASGWIKNVRDHVREGQTVVCKVLDIDESSQQIDLSLKDVNDHQRKDKIQDWKNEQKADKWMAIAFGEDVPDEEYAHVVEELLLSYTSMYEAFEQAAIHGEEAFSETDLTDDEIEAVVQTARDNVSVPYVRISGYIDLQSVVPNGVEDIREALKIAEGNGSLPEEVDLDVTYVGAPEYRIRVKAPDYKTAEAALEDSVERAREYLTGVGGTVSYHREREADQE